VKYSFEADIKNKNDIPRVRLASTDIASPRFELRDAGDAPVKRTVRMQRATLDYRAPSKNVHFRVKVLLASREN